MLLEDETIPAASGVLWRELLSAGGITFVSADVSCIGGPIPSVVAVVVVPPIAISAALATTLDNFVNAGGALLSSRPGANLGTLAAAQWITVEQNDPLVAGLEAGSLRIHAAASAYELDGARAIAQFSRTPGSRGARAAISAHERGLGRAVAFSFDPLVSVAASRQGRSTRRPLGISNSAADRSLRSARFIIPRHRASTPLIPPISPTPTAIRIVIFNIHTSRTARSRRPEHVGVGRGNVGGHLALGHVERPADQ